LQGLEDLSREGLEDLSRKGLGDLSRGPGGLSKALIYD
jgi:hypothetical protein